MFVFNENKLNKSHTLIHLISSLSQDKHIFFTKSLSILFLITTLDLSISYITEPALATI